MKKPLRSARLMIVETPLKRIVNILIAPLICFILQVYYSRKIYCNAISENKKVGKFKIMQQNKNICCTLPNVIGCDMFCLTRYKADDIIKLKINQEVIL